MANAERFELDAVHELGKRLLGDRCGAAPLYGIAPENFPEFLTSWNGKSVDPDDPVVLVRELESTGPGCRWLIARWEELNERLGQAPSYWQAYERFMAVRLLGKQPLEAAIDRNVAEIYLASFGLDHTQPGNAWSDFKVELTIDAHDQFVQRIRRRWSDIVHIEEQVKARQILTDLVARNLEQLKAKLAVHDARAKETAEQNAAILSVDYSPDGEMLRRHEHKFKNELFRGIDARQKLRKKRAECGDMKSEENSEAAETCGRADGEVGDLRRTGGEGVETCGRADGGVGDPRRTGEDGSESAENRGASFEGTWPTAREWAEFDLWDAEEEARFVRSQLSVVSGLTEASGDAIGAPDAQR